MTGIQPAALLDDTLLYHAAYEDAKQAAWTDLHELLALQVELTHGVLRAVIASGGGKPPEPLELPRPKGVRAEAEPIVMRPHEFGKALGSL
jgi:hypothetical protein